MVDGHRQTNTPLSTNYSIDQKNFTGHMINVKLEEKSYKLSFKVLPVEINWSKNRQEEHNVIRKWKINFNPDLNKQAQEVIFGRKISKINHSLLLFNQNLFKPSSSQKHLWMVSDFDLHLKNVQRKVN